jgi:hypothetical protein
MKLQYASDLHIDEWAPSTNFGTFLTPAAPFLALAGDICSAWDPRFVTFLTWCSRLWHTVFVVAGNHEYHNSYGKSMVETDNQIYNICLKFRNVIFLQNGASYTLPGTKIRIVGATLWSLSESGMWEEAVMKKSDYKNIYFDSPVGKRLVLPSEIVKIHTNQVNMLVKALRPRFFDEQLIVITHHMPSKLLLEPEYRGEKWHSFYASNVDFLFHGAVAAWICGHSHRATRLKIYGGPLLLMNARGYNREHELTRKVDIYNPCVVANFKNEI